MSVVDPYLDLPLEGLRLIEASAGTGKTFTLATLATRLVVEHGWRVGELLAVTFTEAATQELRKRIRERLALAARLVGTPVDTQAASPEVALTAELLQRHLAASGEPVEKLRQRLVAAADEIDLSAIFTIHGFCARVLREHALESGQTFAPPELLANTRELHDALAADLWRAEAATVAGAEDLPRLWSGGPDALAADLPALLRATDLRPADEVPGPEPEAARATAAEILAQAIDTHLEDAQALIAGAFERKVLHGGRAKRRSFEKAFAELRQGLATRDWPRGDKLHIDKLLPERLRYFCYDNRVDEVPACALFDALRDWVEADERVQQWLRQRRVHLLHRVRAEGQARLRRLKVQQRVQTYDDLIDDVHAALTGPHGAELARRLRAQYRFALVDEFQDTDERQWDIFDRVFGLRGEAGGLPPALFLIGDPKQAIYGFRGGDVHTYLAAAREATPAPLLDRNFRSRPAVLGAIDALYARAGELAFVDPQIRFHAVAPGGQRQDDDFLREGEPAPALTLWRAPPAENGAYAAEVSRQWATAACVAAIHDVLADARAGRALLDGQPVRPGDIAVLVRKHGEATRIQQALSAAGIPAVAAGRLSLYETEQAGEVLTLLLALLHGADDARLRAALATVLVGEDAAAIDALEHDGPVHRQWQLQALAWRERLQRGGPLALLSELCAAQGPRLLTLLDGERRLSNYLQLAEGLQQAQARTLGLHGLVDWLARRIAEADRNDETQLLRLESDAHRVQIVTLHKSKGLEYPLVFLPFVGIGSRPHAAERHCQVTEADGRHLQWKITGDDPAWAAATAAAAQAARAEDARLLYVGLTRAEHALWIASGDFYQQQGTALWPMLGEIEALARTPGVVVDARVPPSPLPRLAPAEAGQVQRARAMQRVVAPDWWVYSFTQLANADAGGEPEASATVEAAGGLDEPAAAPVDALAPQRLAEVDPRFVGNRFGVVMHEAFEQVDFNAWRDWQPGAAAPAGQGAVLGAALDGGGYAADERDDGVAVLTALVGHSLTVALPEGVRLCELPADARRAEMEFHFALRPTAVPELIALLHAHGVVADRHGFGLRRRLEGLMTGLIDLTYLHDGRWYVLDYKSNRLPDYGSARIAQAMGDSEYDLQALIYTLALHRWLRFRLGEAYDYARDFGGIRYLFCRGLDAADPSSPGVHAQRFAPALVEGLDALFGRPAVREALA
ncbi:exodeoxyribonuclease V subunit beta [Stenotrophomonas panacihumi]|uniref:RecBCD enzyme subunit RecB n=1 Tax=Stenotrophomonas panacihumi TaxID=676599 RepID=A0A0Q9ZYA4_9GAMM|nr:exodeoxyribonuclease V subunit beta [Stenotrophomonas panacihumi]KRG37888.1 exodeoxyribonuclease V subunit beta [Stenotrophomonas panacihumi]PTN56059.1 exodeoxyribonuclease V subunit beta [Stenotrophomonas panacihumi]